MSALACLARGQWRDERLVGWLLEQPGAPAATPELIVAVQQRLIAETAFGPEKQLSSVFLEALWRAGCRVQPSSEEAVPWWERLAWSDYGREWQSSLGCLLWAIDKGLNPHAPWPPKAPTPPPQSIAERWAETGHLEALAPVLEAWLLAETPKSRSQAPAASSWARVWERWTTRLLEKERLC